MLELFLKFVEYIYMKSPFIYLDSEQVRERER